jgi:hypothetical protein
MNASMHACIYIAMYLYTEAYLFFAIVFFQDLDRQESEVLSQCIIEYVKLQTEVNELEGMLQDSTAEECLYDILEKSLHDSDERLDLIKMVTVKSSVETWTLLLESIEKTVIDIEILLCL